MYGSLGLFPWVEIEIFTAVEFPVERMRNQKVHMNDQGWVQMKSSRPRTLDHFN